MSFEVLDFPFMLFGCCPCLESTEIATLSCLGIELARVESILTGFKFTDHGDQYWYW
jgi:hypothetical protein